MLWNQGDGRFQHVPDWDHNCPVARSSRGLACDDLDNDGDIDVVILNSRNEATLLRNELSPSARWIQIQLRGRASNRDAVGARVELICGGLSQTSEVHSGRGYQSHFGSRLHFGLGKLEAKARIEQVRVVWPSGTIQEMKDLITNRMIEIVEP